MNKIPIFPNGYIIEEFISKGSFSEVWKGKEKNNNYLVAIKIISKNILINELENLKLKNEININKLLNNQFIIPFFDYKNNFLYHYIIMEYIENGTLNNKIKNNILNNNKIFHYFSQICFALKYLHETMNIIHHDLKLNNILIDNENNIRLIDFGFSIKLINSNEMIYSKSGSTNYISPEIFQNLPHSKSVDIWSLGIILFKLISGFYPFKNNNFNEEIKFPNNLSPLLIDLINKLLEKNYLNKININQIFFHPWFLQYNLIEFSFNIGAFSLINQKIKDYINENSLKKSNSTNSLFDPINFSPSKKSLIDSGRFKTSPKFNNLHNNNC